MTKYKFYFRKPKSEIVKDILLWLFMGGAIYIAATSPYFAFNLWKNFRKWSKGKKKRVYDTFYRLQKEGCIETTEKNHQIYIKLTQKGREKAGWLQIDNLEIKKPKKWDKKWRIVIFDISQLKKVYREAFRGKLKELGFYPLQKSVWITPFECCNEIKLLKEFFGLTEKEVRLIEAINIGEDDYLKKVFKLI